MQASRKRRCIQECHARAWGSCRDQPSQVLSKCAFGPSLTWAGQRQHLSRYGLQEQCVRQWQYTISASDNVGYYKIDSLTWGRLSASQCARGQAWLGKDRHCRTAFPRKAPSWPGSWDVEGNVGAESQLGRGHKGMKIGRKNAVGWVHTADNQTEGCDPNIF